MLSTSALYSIEGSTHLVSSICLPNAYHLAYAFQSGVAIRPLSAMTFITLVIAVNPIANLTGTMALEQFFQLGVNGYG